MHRRCRLALITAAMLSCSLFAQQDSGWLSPGRLSLTASGSYSYRPWNKLNESLKIAQDAINYDIAYKSPTGSAQKILGDVSGEMMLSYRVAYGLSLFLSGDISTTASSTALKDGNQFGSQTLQDLHFRTLGYGVGAEYRIALNDAIDLTPFIVVRQELASMEYNYHIVWSITYGYLFDTQLKETRASVQGGVRLAYHIAEGVSVVSGIQYRRLEFPDLRGVGTYVPLDDELPHVQPYDAVLAEGNGYFGIDAKNPSVYIPFYLLHTLWNRTGPAQSFEKSIRPTSLDLSAFGITLGVRVDF